MTSRAASLHALMALASLPLIGSTPLAQEETPEPPRVRHEKSSPAQRLSLSWSSWPAEPYERRPRRDPKAPHSHAREDARRQRQQERLAAKKGARS